MKNSMIKNEFLRMVDQGNFDDGINLLKSYHYGNFSENMFQIDELVNIIKNKIMETLDMYNYNVLMQFVKIYDKLMMWSYQHKQYIIYIQKINDVRLINESDCNEILKGLE